MTEKHSELNQVVDPQIILGMHDICGTCGMHQENLATVQNRFFVVFATFSIEPEIGHRHL
jgi:hypothetical protein